MAGKGYKGLPLQKTQDQTRDQTQDQTHLLLVLFPHLQPHHVLFPSMNRTINYVRFCVPFLGWCCNAAWNYQSSTIAGDRGVLTVSTSKIPTSSTVRDSYHFGRTDGRNYCSFLLAFARCSRVLESTWRALFGEVCELFSNDRLPLKSHFDWKKRVIYAQAENSWRITRNQEKGVGDNDYCVKNCPKNCPKKERKNIEN